MRQQIFDSLMAGFSESDRAQTTLVFNSEDGTVNTLPEVEEYVPEKEGEKGKGKDDKEEKKEEKKQEEEEMQEVKENADGEGSSTGKGKKKPKQKKGGNKGAQAVAKVVQLLPLKKPLFTKEFVEFITFRDMKTAAIAAQVNLAHNGYVICVFM